MEQNRLLHKRATGQRGVATLVISLVLLFVVTLVTLFGARVGVLAQKASSNQYRANQAEITAEAGLEETIAKIRNGVSPFDTFSANTITNNYSQSDTVNFGQGTDGVTTYYTATASVAVGVNATVITVVSTGTVQQGANAAEAQAQVSQQLVVIPGIFDNFGVSAAIIVSGSITPTGTMDIVGNPNGGGEGQPVTVWTDQTVSFSGAATTCMPQGYPVHVSSWNGNLPVPGIGGFFDTGTVTYTTVNAYGGGTVQVMTCASCGCTNNLSGASSQASAIAGATATQLANASLTAADATLNAGNRGIDIVAPARVTANSTNFPRYTNALGNLGDTTKATKLFQFLFGYAPADWQTVEAKATILTSCSSLDSSSSGFYWINGSCSLSSTIGSPANPVFIVVDGGQLFLKTAGLTGYGMAYIFDDPTGCPPASGDSTNACASPSSSLKTTGGQWYGALIDDSGTNPTAGNFQLIYSAEVLSALKKNLTDANTKTYAPVPGSWKDF